MSTFKLLHNTPHTEPQTYCDSVHHVHIVHPQHITSGFPLEVSLGECDCAVTMADDAVDTTPDLANAQVEGDAPASHEDFEKL